MPETTGPDIDTVREVLRERDERAAQEHGDAPADDGTAATDQAPADDEPRAPE